MKGGFDDADAVQQTLRTGSSHEPTQLSRALVAYASILALQSPEFVSGVRTHVADPAHRRAVITAIQSDPAYAARIQGADAAAALILTVIGADIARLTAAADAIEDDAYAIQNRSDPRRAWASIAIADRSGRLDDIKALSARIQAPSAGDVQLLLEAARTGNGLTPASNTPVQAGAPPYTPALVNALAIAALAALGAEGEDQAAADRLQIDATGEFCRSMSKLNLFQCLAASKPAYEEIFCIGRHVARDLAACSAESMIQTSALAQTLTSP
jgi:hypothetical protein